MSLDKDRGPVEKNKAEHLKFRFFNQLGKAFL